MQQGGGARGDVEGGGEDRDGTRRAVTARRVLVLVDEAEVRRRLCSRLGSQGHLVLGDAWQGDPAPIVAEMRPDLVVVSVNGDAVEALERLGVSTRPLVVALVAGDPLARAAALAAGFDDVAGIADHPVEVAARIEGVLARSRRHGRILLDDLVVDLDEHAVARDGHIIGLTATEFRLLVTFARHPRQVLTKRQLLVAVWGYDDYDVNVVEAQVSALRRKLELWGPRLVYTVRGVGYVLRPLESAQDRSATSTATP